MKKYWAIGAALLLTLTACDKKEDKEKPRERGFVIGGKGKGRACAGTPLAQARWFVWRCLRGQRSMGLRLVNGVTVRAEGRAGHCGRRAGSVLGAETEDSGVSFSTCIPSLDWGGATIT